MVFALSLSGFCWLALYYFAKSSDEPRLYTKSLAPLEERRDDSIEGFKNKNYLEKVHDGLDNLSEKNEKKGGILDDGLEEFNKGASNLSLVLFLNRSRTLQPENIDMSKKGVKNQVRVLLHTMAR